MSEQNMLNTTARRLPVQDDATAPINRQYTKIDCHGGEKNLAKEVFGQIPGVTGTELVESVD